MKNKKSRSFSEYYLGLDIGTDSVGYAVTDKSYNLKKFKGEPVWGVTTFEAAKTCEERRMHRADRRRLDRRQQRIALLNEIFAPEIAKVDNRFFIRLKESALFREDTSDKNDRFLLFNDKGYNDKQYHKDYPTIHHLICDLMESDKEHDIRLIYLACAWLVSHRGHFLSEISKENAGSVCDFSIAYKTFLEFFSLNGFDEPWSCSADEFLSVLKMDTGITQKEAEFAKLLFANGKLPKDKAENMTEEELEKTPYNRAMLIKLMCGGKVAPKSLLLANGEEYEEVSSVSLAMDSEAFEEVLSELGDDGDIFVQLKTLYDAYILSKLMNGRNRISEAKIDVYNKHKEDLTSLKSFVKKYIPDDYNGIFCDAKDGYNNYVAYSGNMKEVKDKKDAPRTASKEDFCKFIKGFVKDVTPEDSDKVFYEDMCARLDLGTFMPKQVDVDNRVIPYQLYWVEINDILQKASKYHSFLTVKDKDGLTPVEKILKIFEYRIPYFVGPLHVTDSNNGWCIRKETGRILPWNIEEKIDFSKTEHEFIRQLTKKCTYLPEKDVLPKESLLYSEFCVLNELNNLKIDGEPISVQLKQRIYRDLFEVDRKVTPKKIKDYCVTNNYMSKGSELSGIDITVKSSLKSRLDFKRLLSSGKLSEDDVEKIIERSACTSNKGRLKQWIRSNYPHLPEADVAYIASKKYKDFGQLSRAFLCDFYGAAVNGTGEAFNIITLMWETNLNLMEILSDKYSFKEEIERTNREFYAAQNYTVSERLDSMYVSSAVKRPILRTLDIISDVRKAMACPPTKIFIKMARGSDENQRGKRTKSRKQQIEELYASIKDKSIASLRKELADMGDMADNNLQSDKLFLYFLQLGKCMYSGETMTMDDVMFTKTYDIDHIYPQSIVKDDSLVNNKVLVRSSINRGEKKDIYPVDASIQEKMGAYWKRLLDCKLINEEKYSRLTRKYGFTNEERLNFINRQIVEVRQSTKVVADVLKELFPSTEIVYVKVGNVTDFKQEYDMFKCREINDLYRAKDAYLSVVVGNVYDTKFSKKWFSVIEKYSMNTEQIYKYPITTPHGERVWNGESQVGKIRKVYSKNHAYATRYAFCRKGGFFDQMPLKASEGLVPRKNGLSSEKYGGYDKTTASFFVLAKYGTEKKSDLTIVPVELLIAEKFKKDKFFAEEYIKKTLSEITGKEILSVEFPLGERILKINTVFELDGLRMCLSGKSSGGKVVCLSTMTQFMCSPSTERYIKRLTSYTSKLQQNRNMKIDGEHDKITAEKNVALYEEFIVKLKVWPYNKRPASPIGRLEDKFEAFKCLSVEDQSKCLVYMLDLFKGPATGCDLSLLGEAKSAGVTKLSSSLSNWKKHYSDVRIVDVSTSGLFETKSENLLGLL